MYEEYKFNRLLIIRNFKKMNIVLNCSFFHKTYINLKKYIKLYSSGARIFPAKLRYN